MFEHLPTASRPLITPSPFPIHPNPAAVGERWSPGAPGLRLTRQQNGETYRSFRARLPGAPKAPDGQKQSTTTTRQYFMNPIRQPINFKAPDYVVLCERTQT